MVAKDDYIIVLDFLSKGKAGDRKAEPIAQALGEKYFNLLEVVLKPDASVKPGDKLYIGGDKRDEVKYIKNRIEYGALTNFAKTELEDIMNKLIDEDEKRFIDFFNKAGPVTTRLHSLELLPGIGKRHIWEIIKMRKVKPFESFKDLKERVDMLPDPKKMIIKRIIEEMENKDRHRLFVASSIV